MEGSETFLRVLVVQSKAYKVAMTGTAKGTIKNKAATPHPFKSNGLSSGSSYKSGSSPC